MDSPPPNVYECLIRQASLKITTMPCVLHVIDLKRSVFPD